MHAIDHNNVTCNILIHVIIILGFVDLFFPLDEHPPTLNPQSNPAIETQFTYENYDPVFPSLQPPHTIHHLHNKQRILKP